MSCLNEAASPSAPVLLRADAVTKILGRHLQTPVLRGVSLQLRQGEFIALTGPSGSGKTTLLYLLGALDQPTSGEIWLNGQLLHQMSEQDLTRLRQREIGFVFQFHFLLPEFTALENVMIPQILGGVSRIQAQRRATALLERVGLSHRLGHRPVELSGGEQQRVAIARALSNRPSLLLADEPTGNLDSHNTEQVFSLLQALNREERIAMICVTHNQELAARTQRILVMRDGRLSELSDGFPDTLGESEARPVSETG